MSYTKKSCAITVYHARGQAGGWAMNCTANSLSKKIEELCRPDMRGSQQLTPEIIPTRIFLHVEVEDKHGFKAFAQGDDGFEAVDARAMKLLVMARQNYNAVHGLPDDEIEQEKRAIQL
jgi:hypothetical protein